jgi:Na+/H+ antiporter NhaC
MKRLKLFLILTLCTASTSLWSQSDTLMAPMLIQPERLRIESDTDGLRFLSEGAESGQTQIKLNKASYDLVFERGVASLDWEHSPQGGLLLLEYPAGSYSLYHASIKKNGQPRLRAIPLWLSLLPPLVAILLALVFKEVLVSLFVGVWTGAFIAGGLRFESFEYYFKSFWAVLDHYIIGALNDSDHLAVILFSILIGGMVAIISRNGGMAGVVLRLSKYARSARSTQAVTWLLGMAIFFDDYANTLIVGNTMRPVSDRFRISREKLAYLVDSTAAPVAAIAFITTWIGAELGYIGDGIAGLPGLEGATPYAIFLSSLKYSFYPVLTLAFLGILIYMGRDFGPMLRAEQRARASEAPLQGSTSSSESIGSEELSPVAGAPLLWYNAFIPVLAVILITILGLLATGFESTYDVLTEEGISVASYHWGSVWSSMSALLGEESSFFTKLGTLIGNSNSYIALLWASLSGVILAVLLTLRGRIMNLDDTMSTLLLGFKTMLPALCILTLAWALAITTKELETATYLAATLQNSLNPFAMPVIIFILAAVIAFSTGSSWSTMAILYPIAIPTTWAICQSQGMDPGISMELLLNVIATVLAASVLGDHCSPISDTTILSSLASECNHIEHVRTQLPYALTVGAVSIICVGLSTLLGGGWLISLMLLILALSTLIFIVWRFGQKV